MKKAIFTLLCLGYFTLQAQHVCESISINNLNTSVSSDGFLFNDYDNFLGGIEYPFGTGKKIIFSGGISAGGFDDFGVLHVAGQMYRQAGTDFWNGPLAVNGSAYNPVSWNKVWKVNRNEINQHISNYNQSGYQMPVSISDWPGSQYNSISQIFAPFVDVNNNGVYDPSYGDYPNVPGDEALYIMFNDNYGPHTESSGVPNGIEIYALIYGYNSTGISALDNTLFVRHTIRNRSQNNYHDFYLGLMIDFEIGLSYSDKMGTDIGRKMIYAYNGDTIDNSGINGANPASVCLRMLNQPLSGSMKITNNNFANGNPVNAQHFYNYLTSKWKDNTHLTYGNDGIGGTFTTNYIFSGNTDTNFAGQSWFQSTVDDLRSLASSGPFNLAPNGYIILDAAITAYPTGDLSLLNQASDIANNFYQFYINKTSELNKPNSPKIYPNPANKFVYLSNLTDKMTHITITDVNGSQVYSSSTIAEKNKLEINTENLPAGLYLITVSNTEEIWHSKFIKE